MSTENSLEDWVVGIDRALNELKKAEAKDRLSILGGIYTCCAAIDSSLHGWKSWLTNPRLMSKYSEDDLKELFDMFKEIAIELLEKDKKWTKNRIEANKAEEVDGGIKNTGYIQ